MIAADTRTWIAYLQNEAGADLRLLDAALEDRQVLMPPLRCLEGRKSFAYESRLLGRPSRHLAPPEAGKTTLPLARRSRTVRFFSAV